MGMGMEMEIRSGDHEARDGADSDVDEFIRLLTHHRHDWLNDLQVLLGYVSLNKHDKLKTYIGAIRCKMLQDSKISRLGYAPLSLYLLQLRTQANPFSLEVEFDEPLDLGHLPLPVETVRKWIERSIGAIQDAAAFSTEDQSSLMLSLKLSERHLGLSLSYDGLFDDAVLRNRIERTIIEIVGENAVARNFRFDTSANTAQIKIDVPFHSHTR